MSVNKIIRILLYAAAILLLSSSPVWAEDGRQQDAQDSWVSLEGDRYRMKPDGTCYENEWFSITSVPGQPAAKPSTVWYYAGSDGKILVNGWHEIGGKLFYFYPGGNSPRKTFFNLEDKRYYVDEEGARKEPGWFSIDNVDGKGNTYTNWYYELADGSLLIDGWHEVDGMICYFDKAGMSYRKRWLVLEDNRYYMDEKGELQKGWFSISNTNSNGQEYTNWYYSDSNGVAWRGGWGSIDGKWYYFDPNGLNYRKRWYVDDGKKERYYLGEDGVLKDQGWFKLETVNASTREVTEYWYYAQESGAVLKDGYKEVDGRRYYFDVNGLNYRKRWITDHNGDRRYMGDDGAMKKKEWFVISGLDSRNNDYNYWYYAEDDGRVVVDRWKKIDGKYYGFNSAGVMRTGWLTDTPSEEDKESSYYYCDENGVRVTGWQWLEIPDSWLDNTDVADYVRDNGQQAYFYFNTANGKKRRSDSGKRELKVDGVTYCFDSYGIMYPGWVKMSSTTPEIKGYRYYYQPLSENDNKFTGGEKVTSTWLELNSPPDVDGSGQKEWYYFDSKGQPVCAGEDSYIIKEIHDDYYVFDMFGVAQYGLLEINGEFYYCGTEDGNRKCRTGKTMVNDGISASSSQYYFDSKGKGVTGIKDGYAYYKGKLQQADKSAGYEVFDIPGEGKRLVNSTGKVMKNTRVTDKNDQKWVVGSGGAITTYGSDEVTELTEPEATVMY